VRLNVKVHHHVASMHDYAKGLYFYLPLQTLIDKTNEKSELDILLWLYELQETSILCIHVIEINLAISFSESWKILKPCLMPSFHDFMIVIEISKFFVLFLL
ncbi:hypothetical protein ACJX0J_028192, partial [Zea mays]